MFDNLQSPLLKMLLSQSMQPQTDKFLPVNESGIAPTGVTSQKGTPKNLVDILQGAYQKGYIPKDWVYGKPSGALRQLIMHESSGRPTAQNPKSTAYGLMQFLDSTWKGTGVQKTSDPYLQLLAGRKYIENRYGSPDAAWNFWQKNKWY